jgi:O-antigen/teichoic acid export membrane protein
MIASIDTITCLVRVGLVLSFVLLGWQLTGIVLGNVIATVCSGILYGTSAHALTRSRWNTSWLRGTLQALKGRQREILGFLVYNNLNALFGLIPKQLDVVLLGYFRSPTEVGYYKLAKSLSAVVGYLVGPLQSATYPELVHLWERGDVKELRHKIGILAFRVGLPFALATLTSIPFVAPMLTWLAGEAYLPAVLATQLLVVNMAVWLTFFWLRPLYLSTGRVKSWMVGIAVYACCFVVLAFLAAQFGGYMGLTATLMLVNGLFHIVMAVMVHKLYRRGHDE